MQRPPPKNPRAEVENLLARDLMTPHVISLRSTDPFCELVKAMATNNISAVVIHDSENQGQYYICSHSDVINFLQNQGLQMQNLSKIPIGLIMKGPIDLVDEESSIEKVIRVMNEKGYKRVIIGKNGQATGVISTRDILMWNNMYFKKGIPIALLVMDNKTSILIAKHIFTKNVTRQVNSSLIELFGGAISSISRITEEILTQSGKMRGIQKTDVAILFEEDLEITAILACDNPSLELRRKLRAFLQQFRLKYHDIIAHLDCATYLKELPITEILAYFD
jgi:predicted transcriptional regulator